jgi:glutaminyl-peptide cyclotransferase
MYCQGLLILGDCLYESSGGYAESVLRRCTYPGMQVLAELRLPDSVFAEGIASVGDTIYLLTWREETCLRFLLPDLTPLDCLHYEGEGWGLTSHADTLFMSDGTDRITMLDPSFGPLGEVHVRLGGRPVGLLNELEWADGRLYANRFTTDLVYEIDPSTGEVTAVYDATGLLDAESRRSADVLNGIADAGQGRLLLTGKLWPMAFIAEPVHPGR